MENVLCDFCQDLTSEKECPSCTNMVCKECLGKEDLCPDCKAPGHEVLFTDGCNECGSTNDMKCTETCSSNQ